jgi:hypothetical protein
VIAADDQQFLAGRGVPARRVVVRAAVAHAQAVDDGVAKRPAGLDDPPAHGQDVIVSECARQRGLSVELGIRGCGPRDHERAPELNAPTWASSTSRADARPAGMWITPAALPLELRIKRASVLRFDFS